MRENALGFEHSLRLGVALLAARNDLFSLHCLKIEDFAAYNSKA
jgi:hypothetical protein